MSERYRRSEEMLARTLKRIPLGSQTFSKSKAQYPYGASPYFLAWGRGSHVWDIDGNEYIDFINSLAAITLGHDDPDVTAAVKAQLECGVIFSLPHPIETQVAEKIVEMVPCAEMVRFGKNGSDATAGAIRLARAFTRRDHVAVCGYHGWQDWYIGCTSRNLGVPQATCRLTHSFKYNNLNSLRAIFKEFPDQVAAVIMEPMNSTEPTDGFLEEAREITHKQGALFIFDETITGFRFARGGAQEYFDVTPDLATFGKGLANGYPVSALVGRAEVMRLMEDVFFSFTFGGETLSLAASLATMSKLQREPVVERLHSQGEKIIVGTQERIKQHGIGHILSISGHPAWSFLIFKDTEPYSAWHIKTLFLQEVFSRGFLIIGTHNLCYAHTDSDLGRLLTAYDEVFPLLRSAVDGRNLEQVLRCQKLEPVFTVR